MSYRISLILILLLLSCKQHSKPETGNDLVVFDKLVEAEMLKENISRAEVVVIDFRQPEFYTLGHIPGAINLWRTDLENKDYPYSGMRPNKEDLEAILGAKGINSDAHIVVYDEKGSVDAARFWWLLKYYHFDAVSILDGGLSAWQEAGGEISTISPQQRSVSFNLSGRTRDNLLVTKEQLVSWLDADPVPVKILDVRSEEEHSGELKKKGAYRAGRIPSSQHLEWTYAVEQDGSIKFKGVDELKKIFMENGIYPSDTIVLYCHSGSRSSHTAFVLEELLNYNWIKNYDGSWTEWSYYGYLPIEMDSLVNLNN